MSSWIFLRPWCLLGLVPVMAIAIYWWFRSQKQNDWQQVCDPQLLQYLQYTHGNQQWRKTWFCVISSLVMMVLGLAGPSWYKIPAAIGQIQKPVMVIMDLSPQMLLDDISPSRVERAKFLLEDILQHHQDMQWGLMVFSQMPFLVSPITNDIQNILNFLPVMTPQILPVGGYDVEKALDKAKNVLNQAGYSYGKFLVISARRADDSAINWILQSQKEGFDVYWVDATANELIGDGKTEIKTIGIKHANSVIHKWLNKGFFLSKQEKLSSNKVMQWKDEGRWFVGIAMILLMGVFRKGWFLRLWV
jgi:Ca-activated chloride channel family protein